MDLAVGKINGVVEDRLTVGRYYQTRPSKVHDLFPARTALILGLILIVLQAADGLLTSIGVSRFGIDAEGNPLLRHLMEEFGHIPTLAILKILAIVVICALTMLTNRVPWLHSALGAISCIYFFAAILPWTYILFIRPDF